MPNRAFRVRGFALALGLLAPVLAGAQDTILHTFTGGSDGAYPFLMSLASSGSVLYGQTSSGGGSNNLGTIFSINTDGTGYTLLHSYTTASTDGRDPQSPLTLVGNTLYGMTYSGGSTLAYGSIFSMNTNGTGFTVLHNFGTGSDGDAPMGTSLVASGTTLYGMATSGGSGPDPGGDGVIFKMNTNGTGYTLLHSFSAGASDGAYPEGSLTLSGTKLYGTTTSGGNANENLAGGTIFSENTDGTGYQVLHVFGQDTGGWTPNGGVTVIGSKMYGVTQHGGTSQGVFYSMNLDGSGFTILHDFASNSSDGGGPTDALTLIGSKFFGTLSYGGPNGDGAIFSVNTDGTGYQILGFFTGQPGDGASPYGSLTPSTDDRTFYGLTDAGGSNNMGTIFAIPSGVPEPATPLLLAAGAALSGLRRRHRLSTSS